MDSSQRVRPRGAGWKSAPTLLAYGSGVCFVNSFILISIKSVTFPAHKLRKQTADFLKIVALLYHEFFMTLFYAFDSMLFHLIKAISAPCCRSRIQMKTFFSYSFQYLEDLTVQKKY